MTTPDARVLIVGGGIAGLAAAVRLAENGAPVEILERRHLLGGRASSFSVKPDSEKPDSSASELVDNCQHVLMRCCVNLIDFYQRIGAADAIRFYNRFEFLDAEGRWSTLQGSRWLPAPLHLAPSLLRFRSFTAADKVAIVRGMSALARLRVDRCEDERRTFSDWLDASRQTAGARQNFWQPIIVSALNEHPSQVSAAAGFQLFRDGFLRNRRGFEMGLPAVALGDLYSRLGGSTLERLGVTVRTGVRVDRVVVEHGAVRGVEIEGRTIEAGAVIGAVPWHAVPTLLDPELRKMSPFAGLPELEPSPITGIHLWFDRPVADRPHVALLGREMQWIFRKDESHCNGSYVGLVVSASRSLTALPQSQIVRMAHEAVRAAFPAAGDARVVRELVIREPRATFSPRPGSETLRPEPRTPIAGLYLAGDWIRTGWPATMEGAVRGGYLCASALLSDRGVEVSALAPELPADPLPRLLGL